MENVTVEGSARSELDLNYVSDVTIDNVTLNGNGTGGVGLALTECTNVSISNIATSGNTWGGVGLYSYGEGDSNYQRDTDGVTFSGDNSYAESLPVYQDPATAVTNVTIGSTLSHKLSTDDDAFVGYFASEADAQAFVESAEDLTPSNSTIEEL